MTGAAVEHKDGIAYSTWWVLSSCVSDTKCESNRKLWEISDFRDRPFRIKICQQKTNDSAIHHGGVTIGMKTRTTLQL